MLISANMQVEYDYDFIIKSSYLFINRKKLTFIKYQLF